MEPIPRFTIVIPVKGTPAAKSRFGSGDNSPLAIAMALDTVEVALAVADVIVVTTNGDAFVALGARVIPDPGHGLNAAIRAGLENASDPTAILLADHPALTVAELADALRSASAHDRAMVADADGTGTALTVSRGDHEPQFGTDSRAAHVNAGYVELDGDWPGLRRDVDTAEQLAALPVVGGRTSVLAAQLGR